MRRMIWILIMVIMLTPLASLQAQNVEYVGSFGTPSYVYDASVIGSYAYIANGDSGLLILDVANPTNIIQVGRRDTPGSAYKIFVSNNYAYLADDASGLEIIDVNNPANPVWTGNYIMSAGNPFGFFVDTSCAYIVQQYANLQIVNITDPTNPTLISTWDDASPTGEVFALDTCVYLPSFQDLPHGFEIIGVSDPSQPTLIGSFPGFFHYGPLFVLNNYAYLIDNEENFPALVIIDISNPRSPWPIGNLDLPFSTYSNDIFILGNYAYIADTDTGIGVADITIPSNPRIVGGYHTPGSPLGIYVSNGYIYVADITSLQILRFNPTGIEEDNAIPNTFAIAQNYPNPFNPTTQIKYGLPKDDNINISVYNLLGQKVVTLFDGEQNAGEHSISWDAEDFPSGVYFARLISGEKAENIKMVLMK